MMMPYGSLVGCCLLSPLTGTCRPPYSFEAHYPGAGGHVMPNRRIIVVCGDAVAQPLQLADQLRRCVQMSQPGAGGSLPCDGDGPASTSDPADDRAVVLGWTAAPATLVTDVHVAVCCFSPCHPLSFLNAVEQWAPLFAHLPNVLVVLVATGVELLASRTCQQALAAREVEPVDLDDIIGATNDLEVLFNDADATFAAVMLSMPVDAWVGRGLPPSCPLPINDSIQRLGRVVMAEGASGSVEVAMKEWWEVLVQSERDAEERGALAEWMYITHSATAGVHQGDVVAPPVYASRKTKQIALTMPALLAHQTYIREEDPTFEERCRVLKEHTPETYLLRKAMADADRRRAIDRSGKRDVVADPILLMHERRGILSHEVQALERKRDKLKLQQKELADKRAWLDTMQQQLDASMAAIAGEAMEERAHSDAMAAAAADIVRGEAEAETLLAIEGDLAGGAMQAAVDGLMRAYQAEWMANKTQRTTRDAVDYNTTQVASQTEAAQGMLARLAADEETLRRRVEHHLTDMNQCQDRQLRLEAQLDVLASQLCNLGSAVRDGRSRDSNAQRKAASPLHSMPQEVYLSDGGVGKAALDVAASCQRAYQRLIAPLLLFTDTVASPLEIEALTVAVWHQKRLMRIDNAQPQEEELASPLTALQALESSLRLQLQCAELQGRCTGWIDACVALDASARRSVACVVAKADMLV